MSERRLAITAKTLKAKMNSHLVTAIETMSDALAAVSSDPEALPTKKFKMAQEYLNMFLLLDKHTMTEENHRADMRLKDLAAQQRHKNLLDDGEGSYTKGDQTTQRRATFDPNYS